MCAEKIGAQNTEDLDQTISLLNTENEALEKEISALSTKIGTFLRKKYNFRLKIPRGKINLQSTVIISSSKNKAFNCNRDQDQLIMDVQE